MQIPDFQAAPKKINMIFRIYKTSGYNESADNKPCAYAHWHEEEGVWKIRVETIDELLDIIAECGGEIILGKDWIELSDRIDIPTDPCNNNR